MNLKGVPVSLYLYISLSLSLKELCVQQNYISAYVRPGGVEVLRELIYDIMMKSVKDN